MKKSVMNACLEGRRPLTVGGDRLIVEPRRSCGPMLECRRVGSPLPGVPPGDEAHDGAMRIFGVIKVLSDSRRLGNALATRRKLLSGDDGEQPNHQPPSIPEPVNKRTAKIKNIQNTTHCPRCGLGKGLITYIRMCVCMRVRECG